MTLVKGRKAMAQDKTRLTYTVAEAAALLGISRGSGYEAAKSGQLPVLKIGGRLLVPKAALDRMLGSAGAPAAA